MSFTSMYRAKPCIRAWFRERWPRVRMALRSDILVDSVCGAGNSGTIGTAFDYLLRFKIEKLNPGLVVRTQLIAEEHYGSLSDRHTAYGRRVKEILDTARENLDLYLVGDIEIADLCKDALMLGSIDIVFRAGGHRDAVGFIDMSLIEELKALIELVDDRKFIVRNHAILNPTFGSGSILVGGADADLILDNTLVDIKTARNLHNKVGAFDQLIGYYILSRVGGLYTIERLSIYFARFDEFWSVSVPELFAGRNIDDDVEDFRRLVESC